MTTVSMYLKRLTCGFDEQEMKGEAR